MADNEVIVEKSHQVKNRDDRFRILVCIDGSDEGYRGLRYAAKLGRGVDADIVLMCVRPLDQGLRSGGLQVRVARENMLKWGLELPGIKYLKKGKDLLMELGNMSDDWEQKNVHIDVDGDPLGDNKIEYTNPDGKMIVLKMKVATDVASGILEQWELGHYDLIIIGASERWKTGRSSFWDPAVAEKIAIHAPCSVLVARELEYGHGHLVCTDGSQRSVETVQRDGILASRCDCEVSLIAVALDEETRAEAEQHLLEAEKALLDINVTPKKKLLRIGNPVDEIIEAGPDFSLIVVSDTGKSGLKRFFMGSVAFQVMEHAHNSVLILR